MEDININEATSKDLLAYFQEKCDEEARQAHKKGKLVCWSAALAPPEFFEAMDIAVCYPETHSAGCGAKNAPWTFWRSPIRKAITLIFART